MQGSGDPSIQGFATDISVNRGDTVHFKIDTASTNYRLDIYRMGYYDGDGARKVATVEPSAGLPQEQPPCEIKPSTGLVDCGSWDESASWNVPASAVSGIYFAKLVREDKPSDGSHIIFVVRDDGGHSDLLFQTSDTTWQAYNRYGGNSLYEGGPGINPGRAYKVSYNRPLTTRGPTPEDDPFSAEYPMVRWLERNGYDVSYFTGVDADRRGGEILDHKVYLSVGHDEYWSAQQRENVEAARDAGVNLAFFSGNEVFWKTRWEDSIDGSGTDHRTLVCYKETHANAKIDPEADVWTGTWRDPRFSPPADGGKSENALTGTSFSVNAGTAAIRVPAADGKMRFWRNTSVASLAPGQTATLADETLGYEWDEDVDNGFRPAGLADLSSTTVEVPQRLLDYGSNYGPGSATHHLTLYRASSGALVFGAGTVQWSWGLDPEHDRDGPNSADPRMQQATVNLFADMGAQPGSLQADLTPATQSTDVTPPTTTINSPSEGSKVESGKSITISGIASDAAGETEGGQVAAVEVSTDAGKTWHPASGREQWTYSWIPGHPGNATLLARAVDDSGNLETSNDKVGLEVVSQTCPCSIWNDSVTAPEDPDAGSIELGVKFRSDAPGVITGIRFYKSAGNTGPHVGRLWLTNGTQLGTVTFSGETASGWQTASFNEPIAIDADTTYVASYHAPNGHYAALSNFFALVGADNGPLHALADGVEGANGIFKYGPPGALFSEGSPETFQATNYLVDVVFDDHAGPDTTPPSILARAPGNGTADINPAVTANATLSEPMDASSISSGTVELRGPGNALVPAQVTYSPATRRLALDPVAHLQYSTTYTVTVKGGAGGIKDAAGNPLAADSTWSFTTGAAPPPPPGDGSGGPILVIANAANPFSRYYAEILRAEGLNEFIVKDLSTVTPAVLDSYDVSILGEGALTSGQAQMLQGWVDQGGNLIAMHPDPQLAGLLGLSDTGGTLSNSYLKVDTSTEAGKGIVGQTIQFHGTAERFTPTDSQTIATLYSDASTATANPAVTLRSVGDNGGEAAAFSYDLARSVVYTRQGNPAWAGEDRDGNLPIRSDDLFFGAKEGDVQPDWVDLSKVQIPQADEQQRLLTNLIERMNADRKPLPRFWFLPRDAKAAVVMTGDDHGNGGTAGRFDKYEADSPEGCVVAKWECVRSTAYIFPSTPLSDAQAASYNAAGFEIALHTLTDCGDWPNQAALEAVYSSQGDALAANFPSLPAPSTNRTHCVVWSDWATQPKVELQNGVRFDTNYYYWPGSWAQDRPGMFTGSGMPMRFADQDGSMIDVYQAATQMTDESEQSYPLTVDKLLDNALGSSGYYGVFTANIHTDGAESADSDAIVASAQARGVPIVSARQMLTWVDGRNRSSFDSLNWSGHVLGFSISPGSGANGLRAMLPMTSASGDLITLERGGTPVAISTQTIKGIKYAFFDAAAGPYTATYGPAITGTVPASPANQNSPKVVGFAPAGSTVRLFTTADCSGSPTATGSAAQFAGGITVSVPDNSTTKFRVTATPSGGSPSSCSSHATYVEDSTAPQTQIDGHPVSQSNSAIATLAFSATDPGGSGVASLECRLDSTEAAAWAPCSSPKSYSGLSDGAHTFESRAIDQAGNVDASPATFSWMIDTVSPAVSIDSLSKTLLRAGQSSQVSWHANENGSFELRVGGSDCASGAVLDSGSYSSQPTQHSSTVAAAALVEGANTLRLCLADAAANGGSATATLSLDSISPTTQIDTHPSGLSGSPAAEFSFSGADPGGSGVSSFECRLDSTQVADWGSCPSPKSYAALGDGAHAFEVRAVDQAGNADASPASFSWSVDTTPPDSQIANHPAAVTDNAAATFTFTGTDSSGSGVASFQCRLDSSQPSGWTSCSSPQAYASLANGGHTFEVRALDQAGNLDPSPAAFSWSVDTISPDTQITGHPASLSSSSASHFTLSGSDPGGTGVASFQCRLDSTQVADWGSCSSPSDYASLSDGGHTFEVRAVDQAGNTDASPATFSWNIDTTAPQTQITSSPAALTASAAAEFAFSGADTGGSGVVSFECRRDSTQAAAWAPCTSPKVYTGLSDGSHTFEVRAVDQAGNVDGSSAASTWAIDTTPPDTQISAHPTSLSGSAAATFTFSGSDSGGSGIASFECRRDSTQAAAWAPCTSPRNYTSLADGSHTFEVRAIDQAGNVDASPATFSWSVDTTAPQTQIDSGPPSLTASATAGFTFSGADTGGSGVASFECRLDSAQAAAWAPCSSPKAYASLADGGHTLEVRAVDQAANADASPAVFSWSVDTTPPDSQIATHPASLTGNAAATFTFSGTDSGGSGVVSFQCRRDSSQPSDWSSCSSPQAYASLADGDHTFEVRAIDQAGNADGSPATFGWSVDTTLPDTQIVAHPASPSNDSAAQLTLGGTDPGGSGVASFECRLDSTQAAGWGACPSPKSYAGLADGSHTFEVRAVDQAGNVDASPAAFTWTVDTTVPLVTIDSGPSGLTNNDTPTFEFQANEPGATFECSIDAGVPDYGPCSGPSSHTPPSALLDGPYTFRVRATDGAGNQGVATQAFTLDTSAPDAPELTAVVPSSPANQNSPKIVGTAAADSTVGLYTTIDCSGTPVALASAEELAAGVTVSVPDDSTTKFRATSTSPANNPSACSAPLTYVEDSSAPQTQIDGHPTDPVSSALATFVFSASDPGGVGPATFQCRLDSSQESGWTPCSSAKSYTNLSDGAHSFEVRALDSAGNFDASPASFTWRIDTTSPDTQIGGHPAPLSGSAAAEFTFGAADPGGSGVASFECRLDSAEAADWAPCSSPKSYPSLSDGPHGFEVRAIDQAGNADASPANFSWTTDAAAPSAPDLTATAPASPANENSPLVVGSAPAGTTVRLYASASCSGTPLATGSAAELAAGIAIAVLNNSTTVIAATATSPAGNASPCSVSLTYLEDSNAPQTQIDAGPVDSSQSPTALFNFSGSDSGGSGVAGFECRLDSAAPAAWAPCTSPQTYDSLANGSHSFEVRAIDQVGNVDGTPATFTWSIDRTGLQGPKDTATTPGTPTVIGSAQLLQIKYNRRKGTALLIFSVSGPGKLTATAPPEVARGSSRTRKRRALRNAQAPQILPSSIDVTEAGTVKLPIKLSPAGKKQLLENHPVRVRVQITFESADATATTRTIAIVLKKRASGHKK